MSEYISSDQVSSSVILDSGNMPVSDGGAAKGALSSLVVTTAADVVDANDGVTSLREALAAAMSGVTAADGTYTITFDRSLAGKSITLNSEL